MDFRVSYTRVGFVLYFFVSPIFPRGGCTQMFVVLIVFAIGYMPTFFGLADVSITSPFISP